MRATAVVGMLMVCVGCTVKPVDPETVIHIPKIKVDAKLSEEGVVFGEWLPDFVNNEFNTTITAGTKRIGTLDIRGSSFNRKGVKTSGVLVKYPELSPGEKGMLRITLTDSATFGNTGEVVLFRKYD